MQHSISNVSVLGTMLALFLALTTQPADAGDRSKSMDAALEQAAQALKDTDRLDHCA
jgi:hypothetical protein